jgi:hypothetical protein
MCEILQSIYENMGEFEGHYDKLDNPITEMKNTHNFTYMKSLK